MLSNIATFLGVFATSVFFIAYLDAVKTKQAEASSIWASLIMLLAGAVFVAVAKDRSTLVSAILGSWVGTWLGVKLM